MDMDAPRGSPDAGAEPLLPAHAVAPAAVPTAAAPWAIACLALVGGAHKGYDAAMTNGLVPRLEALVHMSSVEKGALAASLFAGAVGGSFLGGGLLDTFGRR